MEIARLAPNELPAGLTGSFDGAVLGWSPLTHIPGADARVGLMRAMGVHLTAGSPLLVSFLPKEPHRTDALVVKIANAMRWTRRVRLKAAPGDRLMFQYRHLFAESEVRAELSAAGFEIVHFGDHPYGHAMGKKK